MSIRPKKKFGQNFLKNKKIAEAITSLLSLNKCNRILEIGPGKGILTDFLISPNISLKVIEIDQNLSEILRKKYSQLEIINIDFLKFDLKKIDWDNYSIIGNFPYNISSSILFKIIDNRNTIHEVIGMFQKEVAERICSTPNSKKYGIPSVLTQAFFKCEILFDVGPDNFFPKPKVTSTVIKLTRKSNMDLGCDYFDFKKVVKLAFAQRRKKIKNTLKNFINFKENNLDLLLNSRAEQLSVDDFVTLTQLIFSTKS